MPFKPNKLKLLALILSPILILLIYFVATTDSLHISKGTITLISKPTKSDPLQTQSKILKNNILGNNFSYSINGNILTITPYTKNKNNLQLFAQNSVTYKINNLNSVFSKKQQLDGYFINGYYINEDTFIIEVREQDNLDAQIYSLLDNKLQQLEKYHYKPKYYISDKNIYIYSTELFKYQNNTLNKLQIPGNIKGIYDKDNYLYILSQAGSTQSLSVINKSENNKPVTLIKNIQGESFFKEVEDTNKNKILLLVASTSYSEPNNQTSGYRILLPKITAHKLKDGKINNFDLTDFLFDYDNIENENITLLNKSLYDYRDEIITTNSSYNVVVEEITRDAETNKTIVIDKYNILIDKNNYTEVYKQLNFLNNTDKLQNLNQYQAIGGGGPYPPRTGTYLYVIENPNDTQFIVDYQGYNNFYSQSNGREALKTMIISSYTYDNNKQLLHINDPQAYAHKRQGYGRMYITNHNEDLSKVLFSHIGGDGCGGWAGFAKLQNNVFQFTTNLSIGCGDENNLLSELPSNNQGTVYYQKVQRANVALSDEDKKEIYNTDMFATYTAWAYGIYRKTLYETNEYQVVDFSKYFTNTTGLLTVTGQRQNPIYYVYNTDTNKLTKKIVINYQTGQIILQQDL